jgi:hypothetical protein
MWRLPVLGHIFERPAMQYVPAVIGPGNALSTLWQNRGNSFLDNPANRPVAYP